MNSIYVSLTQGQTLREAIQNTNVEVLGDRPVKFYIGSSSDAATRATDFSATAGEAFTVYGKNILPAGSDPLSGRHAHQPQYQHGDEAGRQEDCAGRTLASHPELPAGLADGEYILTITTQYKGSSTEFLKEPRSTSQSIYIGSAPSGGGESGGDGGLDENPLGIKEFLLYFINKIRKLLRNIHR